MTIQLFYNSSFPECPANEIQDYQIIIMNMNDSSVSNLTQLIPARDISIIKHPTTALVMMCAKDCFNTDFCIGEVLVTEAEVGYRDKKGYAMVIGEEHNKALAIASLDALLQSHDNSLPVSIEQLLALAKAEQLEKNLLEKKLIASTKVSFENMVKG